MIWDLPAGSPPGVWRVLRHAELRILLTELTLQSARTMRRLLEQIGDETDGQQILLVHNPSHGAAGSIPKAQYEAYVGRRIDLALPHAGSALRDSLLRVPSIWSAAPPCARACSIWPTSPADANPSGPATAACVPC